jgi:NAD(P)-dependent dehydrogenase (short-subunit alcohol dehydrogenase family)
VLAENEGFRHGAFNLLEAASAEGIIRETVSTFGRVDIILNVAGARDNFAGLDKVDIETWNKVMMVNVTVPALLSKHAVSEFKRQGSEGSIVNVSSKAGLSGAIAGAAYTTSKHAIVSARHYCPNVPTNMSKIGLTKNIAWRFHNDGIRCNAICPGGECPRALVCD